MNLSRAQWFGVAALDVTIRGLFLFAVIPDPVFVTFGLALSVVYLALLILIAKYVSTFSMRPLAAFVISVAAASTPIFALLLFVAMQIDADPWRALSVFAGLLAINTLPALVFWRGAGLRAREPATERRWLPGRWPAVVALSAVLAISCLWLVTSRGAARPAPPGPPAAVFVWDSLRQWGYFKPRDANLPNVKFYCICGPYSACQYVAREAAARLDYRLPLHDFTKEHHWRRQRVLFFLEHGDIVELEFRYRDGFFADDHESFCDVNLDKRIPRARGE